MDYSPGQQEHPEIKILYEDNHLIVVEKPPNIPSQEDESGDPDMLAILKESIKVRYGKSGNVFLGLVHRLDRPAGGVMVFARTSKAAARLSALIRERDIGKIYFAVVHGLPQEKQGSLKHFLVKDKSKNMTAAYLNETEGAKEAILEYNVLESSCGLSLLKVNLLTGRSHQIRAQLAKAGFPLYGDLKYGSHVNKRSQQLALWSAEISFRHPVKNEELVFTSAPPDTDPWRKFKFFHRQ